MQWTEAQQNVIEHRGSNILVSAAAGSGKTAVLVERLKKLVIEDRVPLSDMLIVTFTEAAAAEMRQKIVDAITDSASEDGFLREQLSKIGSAQISTFHGFAVNIIRRYYHIIDIDPVFRVCDDFRQRFLKGEAMDRLFEERFEENDPAFKDFLLHYAGSKNENTVRDMISETYEFILSTPEPFIWLESAVAALDADVNGFRKESAYSYMIEESKRDIEAAVLLLTKLGELLSDIGAYGLFEKNNIDIEKLQLMLSGGANGADIGANGANGADGADIGANGANGTDGADIGANGAGDEFAYLKTAIENMTFERFSAGKSDDKDAYAEAKDLVKAKRDRAKDRIKNLKTRFFADSLDHAVRDIRDTAVSAKQLAFLVKRFDEIYAETKRNEGLIDFSDIEHFALKILEDEEAAAEYRDKFKYIFIDEYQDSNYVQETLISRIKREDNLFMVGDVKQSIYKFRQAEPELFIEKYSRFKAEEDPKNTCIDLNSNFRSKGGIIDAVNGIFKYLMDKRTSGILYDDSAALHQGLTYDDSWNVPVCLCLVDKADAVSPDGIDSEDESLDLRDSELEALAVAEMIEKAKGTPIFDVKRGIERPLEYRDIVILLREVRTTGPVYYKVLTDAGIPVYSESGDGYFDTIEIETFMNLLNVIDNLRQDVPLVSAMYSPVFGFGTDELIEIRLGKRDGAYYEAFLKYADWNDNDHRSEENCNIYGDEKSAASDAENQSASDDEKSAALRQKCRNMLEKLESWRSDEIFMELDEFLWMLMKESGWYDHVGSLAGGILRQANLRILLDKALDFCDGKIRSLFGFIKYIESIRDMKIPTGEARLLSESDNVVRISTIHKSKGLEYPMVVVGQVGKSLKGKTSRNKILLHREVGLGLQWENPENHTYKSTLLLDIIRHRKDLENKAELVRLFYVALTRAMDRLILVGTVKDAGALIESAENLDPEVDTDVRAAGSYIDMLMPIIQGSDIEIVTVTKSDLKNIADNAAERGSAVKEQLRELKTLAPGKYLSEIADRLAYVYPHSAAVNMKSKYTVSELNRKRHEENAESKSGRELSAEKREITVFIEGSEAEIIENAGLSAAERGVALHRAMEHLNFAEAYAHRNDDAFFENYLDDLVSRHIISKETRGSLHATVFARFAKTKLCERAARSGYIRKEVPFNFTKKMQVNEEAMIQGVIDCWFEEDGLPVLIDYKSGWFDRGKEGEEERMRETYGEQINLYREALETVLGKEVGEAYLYLTNSGVSIAIQRS